MRGAAHAHVTARMMRAPDLTIQKKTANFRRKSGCFLNCLVERELVDRVIAGAARSSMRARMNVSNRDINEIHAKKIFFEFSMQKWYRACAATPIARFFFTAKEQQRTWHSRHRGQASARDPTSQRSCRSGNRTAIAISKAMKARSIARAPVASSRQEFAWSRHRVSVTRRAAVGAETSGELQRRSARITGTVWPARIDSQRATGGAAANRADIPGEVC